MSDHDYIPECWTDWREPNLGFRQMVGATTSDLHYAARNNSRIGGRWEIERKELDDGTALFRAYDHHQAARARLEMMLKDIAGGSVEAIDDRHRNVAQQALDALGGRR
jgi:hypothetical protein